MKKIIDYSKPHIITISYCVFFILALLPTIFSFINKLGVYYKVSVLVLFSIFLLYYIFKHKIKINYRYLVIPMVIFFVFSIYYIAILPTYFTFITPGYSYIDGTSITVVTSFSMRLNSVMTMFNLCFFASIFLIILPSLGLKLSDIVCFTLFVDFITLLACIYSLKQLNSPGDVTSFLGNKNTFGQFLMVAVFVSLLSFVISKNKYLKILFTILTLVFFIFTFLCKSSTAILLSALIVTLAFIFIVLDTKRFNTQWKIVIFASFISLITIVFVSPYIPFLAKTKIGSIVGEIYDKVLSFKGKSFLTIFSNRGTFWAFGGYIVRPEYIMLGYGNSTLEEIVYRSTVSYFTTRELTNAYLTVFNGYGIIGSVFYLAVIAYLFYKYFQSRHFISEWLLMFLIIFLFYGMFESLLLFESFSGSILITPILVVPARYLVIEKKESSKEVLVNE